MSSWTAATGIRVPRLWLRSSVLVISGEHAGRCQAGHMTGSGGLRAWERASWASTDRSCAHRRPQMTHLTPLRLTPLPNFSARSFHHEGTWTSATRRLSPASHCHQCPSPVPTSPIPSLLGHPEVQGGVHHQELHKASVHHLPGVSDSLRERWAHVYPLGIPLELPLLGVGLGGQAAQLGLAK